MLIFVRGGGDLASGVVLRLFRAGLRVIVGELEQPLVVRRLVSFANAIYEGQTTVEEVEAKRVSSLEQALSILHQSQVPVLVDPKNELIKTYQSLAPTGAMSVLVDGRMTKTSPHYELESASLIIGLGPGFVAGLNCHAAVETNRGHLLGHVIWQGAPQQDTGVPESVSQYGVERVLRAPADGELVTYASIGDQIETGQLLAEVAGQHLYAPLSGVLRGMAYPGLKVQRGLKIGDIDPRGDARYCRLVSDKALAIGGAVLEAILSQPVLRSSLWDENAVV